ncbi:MULTISPECIES: Rieske (2Fe-2S) protein [Paenibacillus]|uniref:Rieske (2Fe-2S) protein n=1 Tax=Paenibacillus TaxID=44249 RepID=UPI0022B916C0|nr:Rieske (2Fe-2S) protein [Paenibacillus caseinilyticus]MCZ8518190.1 Rieske (2Fe-2S) protein [Paenibacillus caseinilyticus]
MSGEEKRGSGAVPPGEDNYTHNISKDNERRLDRRSFMKTMVGAAGLFAVSTLPWGAIAARELTGPAKKAFPKSPITALSGLKVGEAAEFAYPGEHDSALLVRLGEGEFKAYQNACTHLKCPVFWSGEKGELVCPCHHGLFDVRTGSPIAGPPKRPLPEIELKIEQGTVYAVGVKRYEA